MRRGLRWGVVGLTALLTITALTSDADARGRRHRHHETGDEGYQPSYASIVVDANSGQVMQATNADSPRHPASLTKIMTLYLLFERLEAGKIKLTAEMPVSAYAAAQAPSKLGLKPGETIRVETAIRAIVTKSANDVAVIVSEALSGDESNFAKMMTAKARALGMKGTTYRNASGLPEDQQITTAYDQALLGRAIRDRFPNYYHYFATRTFEFRGQEMRNHNHLLGVVDGVDGIKTGYIHESGFNIVTSVYRANRHIVAVVFGGRTAEARDARVRSLIDNNINIAAVKRTAPMLVEGREMAEAAVKESPKEVAKEAVKEASKETPKEVKEKVHIGILGAAPRVTASATPVTTPVLAQAPEGPPVGSTDPIKPNTVKTFTVHPGAMHTVSLSPLPSDSRKLTPASNAADPARTINVITVKSEAPALPAPPGAKPGVLGVLPAKLASAGDSIPVTTATVEPAAKPRSGGGWMIQVGAFPEEKEAKQRLNAAQSKAKDQLGQANPFTEKVNKGDKALFRARFAGLERGQAETVCHQLKRSEIPCIVVKN